MMAANSIHARSVHKIGQGIWLEDAEFDEEAVGATKGEFVVLLVRVVVGEGVASVVELHEVTAVFTTTISFCKSLRVVAGDNTIRLAVIDEAWREVFLREIGGGAEEFTHFGIGKEFITNAFGGGVSDGAEEDHRGGLWRRAGLFVVRMQGRTENCICTGTCSDGNDTVGVDSHA